MLELRRTAEYDHWMRMLRNIQVKARINARIRRLTQGNPGQHRVLTGGIIEMKIDCGPGYRVYYTKRGSTIIILLCGGDKASQQTDISRALALASHL
jgi:putative addiction module killer protein